MCNDGFDDGYGKSTNGTDVHPSFCDMFWRHIHIADYINKWNHRNLESCDQQHSNDNIYVYSNCRTMCNNGFDDGNSKSTNGTYVHPSFCDMFWRYIYFANYIDKWHHRNLESCD